MSSSSSNLKSGQIQEENKEKAKPSKLPILKLSVSNSLSIGLQKTSRKPAFNSTQDSLLNSSAS